MEGEANEELISEEEEAEKLEEEEPVEEEAIEEEILEEVDKESTEEVEEERTPSTIDLQVYYGPTFSSADRACYYRVEAIVTGNPTPEVDFSKDDSGGTWGPTKCQANLYDPTETYTLAAKATNSEGYATDSLTLTWGCSEGLKEEEAGDGESKEIIFEGKWLNDIDWDRFLTLDKVILHPINIGYIVYPTGINTETCIVGDSISDARVRGFFGFDRLGGLSGREVESVTLELNNFKVWDDPRPENLSDIRVSLELSREIFPLDSDDWLYGRVVTNSFTYNQNPIIWHDEVALKNYIQENINSDSKAEFLIYYDPKWETDWDGKIDGREFRK